MSPACSATDGQGDFDATKSTNTDTREYSGARTELTWSVPGNWNCTIPGRVLRTGFANVYV